MPPEPRLPARDAALLVLISVVWGLNFIPIRWALDEVPPFALSSLRFLLAAVPMALLVPRPAIPLGRLVAYGFAIGVVQFGLLFLAISAGLAAGLASLLMQLQMFFTMGLAALFAGDRVRRHQVLGAVVSFAGLALLAWSLLQRGAQASALSLLLILGAAFAWAAGNVIAKAAARRHAFDMFALVVWSSLVAPAPLALLSYALEGGLDPFLAVLHASPRTWGSVLFMSYAATLFGYGAWNRLLHRHPAGVVTPFTMVVPVAGLAGGALVLHESLRPSQLLGAAVILAGIALAVLGGGRPAEANRVETLAEA